MGIFGRKAGSHAEAPGDADVFTAPERECVEALWRLTALPRAEFDATYGAMLGGFWRYAANARGEAWTALRRETLICAVAALRARQARVLPRFAAAEDAAQARRGDELRARRGRGRRALRRGCGPGDGARLAPAHRRRARDRRAYRRPTAAPVRRPAPRPARRRGRARLARPGARRAPRPRRLLRRRPERVSRDRRGGGAPDRLWPLDRGPAVAAPAPAPSAEEATADRPGRSATTSRVGQARTPARADTAARDRRRGRGLGVDQLGAGRDSATAPCRVNAAGTWLHNIAGEAYTVSPACFEAFAAGRGLAPATVRNRVVRLGRHRQRASPSGSANVFRAVLADGRRVEGMVFPGELIWDDDPPPRANAGLVGKGR